jgi:murein DD-endopeptidase MepM/ murein hydrolase activator NlpD
VRRGAVIVPLVLTAALAAPSLPPAAAAPRTSPLPTAVHLVKAGDTLGAIAGRYGVSVGSLVAANGLAGPGARLRIGQRLVIPPETIARVRGALPRLGRRRLASPRTMILAVPDFAELLPSFMWPVDGPVSSTFGRRRMGWHRGIDIIADLGTPVLAAAPGAVVSSAYETRYGRVVKIQHANGFMTVYAHNDENVVELGDRVGLGQIIATVGRTGRATSHHVHFEIRHAGFAYNPLYLLPLPPRLTQLVEPEDEEPDEGDD